MRIRRSSRGRHGQSMADVLVGMALSLVALGTLESFFSAQHRAAAAQSVYSQSQTVTRTVIDLLTRELRMASYDPSGTALSTAPGPTCPGVKQGLLQATPTKLQIAQDLNADGALTGPGETVTYDVLGTQIRRTDGAALPVTLVSNVPAGGLQFLYFDNSNPPNPLVPTGSPPALTPSQRDCVAKVRVTVQANFPNPNPTLSTPITSTAESEVAIRNRSLTNF